MHAQTDSGHSLSTPHVARMRGAGLLLASVGLLWTLTVPNVIRPWWAWLPVIGAVTIVEWGWRDPTRRRAVEGRLVDRSVQRATALLVAVGTVAGLLVGASLEASIWLVLTGALFVVAALASLPVRAVRLDRLTAASAAVCVGAFVGELAIRVGWIDVSEWSRRRADAEFWSALENSAQPGAHGFRTRHEPGEDAGAAIRIVALGDSYTWGDKVLDARDRWTNVLEALSGGTTQCVNLGVCGATTVAEEQVLEQSGWDYSPQVVILQYTANDALPSTASNAFPSEELLFEPARSLLPQPAHSRLLRQSAVYTLVCSVVAPRRLRADFPHGVRSLFTPANDGWMQSRLALGRIAASCSERGVPCVVFFVDCDWTDDGASTADAVASAARELNVAFYDGRAALRAGGLPPDAYRAPDGHPNEVAHRALASGLLAHLRAKGLVP